MRNLISCLLILGSLGGSIFAMPQIRIETDIERNQLIPVISVNGKKTIPIRSAGRFPSAYDRATSYITQLTQLVSSGISLHNLEVTSSEGRTWIGLADQVILEITHEDVVWAEKRPEELASTWLAQLKLADVKTDGSISPLSETPIVVTPKLPVAFLAQSDQPFSIPLIGWLSEHFVFPGLGVVMFVLLWLGVPAGVAAGVSLWIVRRKSLTDDAVLAVKAQVEELQNVASVSISEFESKIDQKMAELAQKTARLKRMAEPEKKPDPSVLPKEDHELAQSLQVGLGEVYLARRMALISQRKTD